MEKKVIIALWGPQDTGKTTTLRKLAQEFLESITMEADLQVVFSYTDKKIAISTGGDDEDEFEKYITSYNDKEWKSAILATPKEIGKLQSFIGSSNKNKEVSTLLDELSPDSQNLNNATTLRKLSRVFLNLIGKGGDVQIAFPYKGKRIVISTAGDDGKTVKEGADLFKALKADILVTATRTRRKAEDQDDKDKTDDKDVSSIKALEDLEQDEDCLDTWFSSWLWPISVFNGINQPNNEEINYYYPTSDLVTGPDIIFFWVARMIMAGYEYRGKMPFKNVYFTGIVRDKLGRKMSKSLGNSPDPIELIEQYGADGVRMGMMLSAPAGNDILFDETLCEQGRNFNNKIWNAFRLVKGWEVSNQPQPEASRIACQWFEAKLRQTNEELNDLFSKYRISEALMAVYRLFWDEFSSWYLEMVKPAYGQPIDNETYKATLRYFETLLNMLHPFMPFITEELWQHIAERKEGESIMCQCLKIDAPTEADNKLNADIEMVKQIVSGVRMVRNQKNIAPKEQLSLHAIGQNRYAQYNDVVTKMANLDQVKVVTEKAADTAQFMVGTDEYAVPIGNLVDVEAEIKKQEAQLAHLEGFLAGIKKKLSNERFVANAPEAVVALERKKQSDSEEKIAALKASIEELKKK